MKNLKKLRYILMVATTLFVTACHNDDDINVIVDPTPIDSLPKKEMRAVWITTAWGIDWPQSVYSVAEQKKQYIDYLDRFAALNINTVIVQIKPMGDAFYNSSYEPWSAYITGTRGKDPGYDVLKFMIDEAHARGLEFHAWMNPYRIATRASKDVAYPELDSRVNPNWVVNHEKIQIYNPALPEVRQRLVDIVKEVITKYDVDGIDFDDYFYPDPSAAGTMVSDQGDFDTYGNGYATIADFRRANVDKTIQAVHDVIVANKPGVLFTISPAASNDYNYGTLYADVTKWAQEGWIDIVMPQLYAHTASSSNNFKERVHWWPQFSFKAVPVIGYALYKFGDNSAGTQFMSVDELDLQFKRAALEPKVKGSAMYSAKSIMDNKIGITDKLAMLYSNPAIIPFIGRKTEADPAPATNVRLNGMELRWDAASGLRSVVYLKTADSKIATVMKITLENSYNITLKGEYFVTILNRDNTESLISSFVEYK